MKTKSIFCIAWAAFLSIGIQAQQNPMVNALAEPTKKIKLEEAPVRPIRFL